MSQLNGSCNQRSYNRNILFILRINVKIKIHSHFGNLNHFATSGLRSMPKMAAPP
uniref:Uncharacterized protein n=1 Tax=Anguilla anguilla TaxID=7936 RepID=A0A0E9VAV7_ANGAN